MRILLKQILVLFMANFLGTVMSRLLRSRTLTLGTENKCFRSVAGLGFPLETNIRASDPPR